MIRPSKIHWEPRDYRTCGELCLNEPRSPLPHRISYEGKICIVAWAPNAQFIHYTFTFSWEPGGFCCGDQGPRCALIGAILDALPIEKLLPYGTPIKVERLTLGPTLSHSHGRRIRIDFKFRAQALTSMPFEDANAEARVVLIVLDRAIEHAFAESETPTVQTSAVAAGHATT